MKGIDMLSSSLRRIAASVSLATLIVICALFGSGAFAQSGAGSIQGTVTDAASAVVPNCSVDVVNVATGVTSHTTTNNTGFFAVPNLFVGTYTITFTARGMKRFESRLELQDGQVATLNAKLAVGSVSEQVTVEASAVQLATYDSGTVSTELDIHRIDQLPMNGRSVLALASDTVPGVEADGTRANGQMAQAMEYTQDGAPMTDRQFGGELGSGGNSPIANVILPDPDSVQEVRFETVGSSAALSTPATVELTTKSGTNSFHGSAFETNRDNYFGIAKSRQNPSNYKAPEYIRNEFGASVGGPITIPRLYSGKDKSFFFFAYERYSLRQGVSQLEDVMSDAERGGDFSAIVVGGVQQVIYDPSTSTSAATGYQRTQYAYNGHANTINPALISPLAKAMMAAMPHATNQSVVPQSGQPNLTQNIPNASTAPKYTFRLDQVFNEKNRAYLRFTYQPETVIAPFGTNINAAVTSPVAIPYGISADYGGAPQINISSAAQYSHVFSPTFFAETVAGQQWLNSYYGNYSYNGVNYESLLGLPNSLGNLGSPGITGFNGAWQGTQGSYGIHQIISNLDENLTKIAGKHQVQFGGRYRHERFSYQNTVTSDSVAFSTTATSLNNPASCPSCTTLANTGIADASFLIGDADSYGLARPSPRGAYYDNSVAPYVQDNWHASRSLTLNLGLRWEMDWAPSARNGNIAFFDYKNDALVMPNTTSFYVTEGLLTQAIVTNLQNLGAKFETASQANLPASGTYNNLYNFNPRLGFAWTPGFLKHGTVIRGAFGAYLYPVPIRTGIQWYTNGIPWVVSYAQSYTSATQSPDGLPDYDGRAAQSVIAGQASGATSDANVVNTSSTNAIPPYPSFTAPDPHYPGAHVQNYDITVEQPLKDGSVIRASYVYAHGYDLDQNFAPNTDPSSYIVVANTQNAPPANAELTNPYDTTTWGGLTDSVTTGWSNDSSLQLNYQRAFKHGYAYQIYGVYSSAFRVGGNAFRDSNLTPGADFLTSSLPSGLNPGTLLSPSHALDRMENYIRDTAIPRYRLQYNGVVDLPFGTGKHFLHNANRLLDEIVGGYQVAFTGTMVSQSFQPISGSELCFSFGCYNLGDNWGATSPFKMYKNTKITDCSGGSCIPGRLWYNGYIAPTANGSNSACTKNCISGLPSDYVADEAPIFNTPGATIATIVPAYGTNYVLEDCSGCASSLYGFVPTGKSLQTKAPGHALNPLARSVLQGPKNGEADISLFKVFKITEGTSLRINVDAFNAFNIQGLNNPNTTTGSLTFLSSYWTPRQIQLSGRFTF